MVQAGNEFCKILERSPIIAAVFSSNDLQEALLSPCEVIFLLGGNVCELQQLVQRAHEQKKKIYVHLDLLTGLGKDQYAVQYLKDTFAVDGIITTKNNIVKYAKDIGVFVIQRFFMLDSKAFDSALRTVKNVDADSIEILPGIIPGIIGQISRQTKIPVIGGGLIRTKKEAIECLNAGGLGVSTSCKDIWHM